MAYMIFNPESDAGHSVSDGECVRFVQTRANMPNTSHWRQGVKVRGRNLTKGTVIATFVDGQYPNHKHGNHAAVYDSQDATGIWVWDQYHGHPVAKRQITFRGTSFNGSRSKNGDTYYVVE